MLFLQTLYGQTRKVILHRKTQGKKQPDKFSPIWFKAKQSGNQTPVVGAEGSDEWSDGSYRQSLHKELSDLELSIPQVKRSAQGCGGLWQILCWNFGFRSARSRKSSSKCPGYRSSVRWLWKHHPALKPKIGDNRTYMKTHDGVVVFDGFYEIRVRIKLTIRKPINVGAPWCHMSSIKRFPKSL